jgi:anti-sigma-K factor RskA
MRLHDDPDLRAGEYVLGTLELDERVAVEARARDEGPFAAAILAWEKRFAPLHELVAPVAAPETVWPRISERLGKTTQTIAVRAPQFFDMVTELAGKRGPDAPSLLMQAMRRWRAAAIVSGAAAVSLAAFVVAEALRRLPPPPSPLPSLYSVLSAEGITSPFVVEINPEGGALVVRSVPSLTPDDRSYALWILPSGGTPISLGRLRGPGVLKADALTQVSRTALRKATVAVSIEPNDAPEDKPSAPFVFTGKLDIP